MIQWQCKIGISGTQTIPLCNIGISGTLTIPLCNIGESGRIGHTGNADFCHKISNLYQIKIYL